MMVTTINERFALQKRWLREISLRQLISIPFWIAAICFIVASDVIPVYVLETNPSSFWGVNRASGVLTVIGIVALVLARRFGMSSARQLIAKDPSRSPVLYLRPFETDRSPFAKSADEEVLARIFGNLGPFIAIGKPGEMVPQLGAARLYLDRPKDRVATDMSNEEDWKSEVSEQIRRSTLVVLCVGESEGFQWEARRVFELVKPQQVLFYFSVYQSPEELKASYERFVEGIQDLLDHPLPSSEDIGTNRFLMFGDDWRPKLVGALDTPGTYWRKSLGCLSLGVLPIMLRPLVVARRQRLLSHGLRPFFEHIGYVQAKCKLFTRFTVSIAAAFGLVAFCMMMIINYWRVEQKKSALIACAVLIPAFYPPVVEILDYFYTLLAIIIFFSWPLFAGSKIREHLAFGGPAQPWWGALLVILLGGTIWEMFPRGFDQSVSWQDRAMVVDVDKMVPFLPEVMLDYTMDPTSERISKTGHIGRSFEIEYEYGDSDRIELETTDSEDEPFAVYSSFSLVAPSFDAMLAEPIVFTFADTIPVKSPFIEGWEISSYLLTKGDGPIGNMVTAEGGNFRDGRRLLAVKILGVYFVDEIPIEFYQMFLSIE